MRSFGRDLEKTCSPKAEAWWNFNYKNHEFTESQNGQYGPYAHVLKDPSPNNDQKSLIVDNQLTSWQMTMSKFMGICICFENDELGDAPNSSWVQEMLIGFVS